MTAGAPDRLINKITLGDCRELSKQIADNSVDLIFTDPPYKKEYMHLYGWLAEEAARVLKSDGFLMAYVGTYWKAEVFKSMTPHMDYFFDYIVVNSGNSPIMWHRKTISRHKSIVAFTKPGSSAKPRTNVLSLWNGSGQDKRYHTWGQDESSARYYIDCFSKPGDLVVDYFTGGGTTPYVCKVLDRRFICYEIEDASHAIATERIKNIQPILPGMNGKQDEFVLE